MSVRLQGHSLTPMMSLPPKTVIKGVSGFAQLLQQRGFIDLVSSTIAGRECFVADYGPLGSLLRENILKQWWDLMVATQTNVFPVQSPLLRNLEFDDMFEGKSSEVFNLIREHLQMDCSAKYPQVLKLTNGKLPFSIASFGLCLSKKTCGQSEEMMEKNLLLGSSLETKLILQNYISPSNASAVHDFWLQTRLTWWKKFSRNPECFSVASMASAESSGIEEIIEGKGNGNGSAENSISILYNFPWGQEPVESINNLSDSLHKKLPQLEMEACLVIDHLRKSSVDSHRKSADHRSKEDKMKEAQGSDGGEAVKKQRTLDSAMNKPSVSTKARNDICNELVSVFAAANIPLSKVDHPAVRNFLQTRVENGSAIPQAHQLQECYLKREFVLNILAAPMEPLSADVDKVQSYLLDTRFLSATNHSTVGTAIIECLVSTGIKFTDVITVNTDNAAYMKKAFNEILKGLMLNATHIMCMAHIMSLVGEAFRKPFNRTNKFVKAANAIFWHANARKARYLRFITPLVNSPKMPPNPIATRWNCWFEAVAYHEKNLQHFATFVAEEMEHCGRMAPDSLVYLNDTLCSESERQLIQAEMSFIVQHSQPIITATDVFQSQRPIAMTIKSLGKKAFLPACIECTTSVEAAMAAWLVDAYRERYPLSARKKPARSKAQQVLQLHPQLTPYQVALVLASPTLQSSTSTSSSSMGIELRYICDSLEKDLKKAGISVFNASHHGGSLDAHLRRNDQLGVVYTVIIDQNTVTDGLVNTRSRDTQVKVTSHISSLVKEFSRNLNAQLE
ncbi:glycine--tRNA ligase [Plakobranchus ocellatus]|uniref:Glycine--tRNA ligase n=1 Tax=Plakobranchus ocellatus TaxID=259542 RepID=A0AAV3ZUZ0_9GAST|nr:glycine--tRNA ligase [Plakobranchus ocellatus]